MPSGTRLAGCVLGLALCVPAAVSGQTTGFVYALQSVQGAGNNIYGFTVDVSTGALTPLPGFPVATGGTGAFLGVSESIEYNEAQSRLYAINTGSGSVSVFNVDRATGALSAAPFSPLAVGFTPGCLTVSPDGTVLVVSDITTLVVSAFRLFGSSVAAAPGNPYSTAPADTFSCEFSRDGSRVYGGGNTGTFMAGFSVDAATAHLTPLPGSPFDMGALNPIGYAVDGASRLFATAFSDNRPRAYSIAGGTPTLLTTSAPTGQSGTVHGVHHPFGFYVTTARQNDTVAVLRVSGLGTETTLTAVPGSPFATGGVFSDASVVDATGRVMVTSNGVSRNLTSWVFDPIGSGSITRAVVQPVDTLGATGLVTGVTFARLSSVATPVPPIVPPTITSIPNQSLPQNGTITVPFTIAGGVLPSALGVGVSSSNPALLPVHPSTLALSCNSGGSCTLRIAPADGRAGVALIILTVTDGILSASTSFTVTVTPVRPSAPAVVLVSPLGSGFAVTWSPSETGAPFAYAVSWGTNATASNLPLQLVPGTTPRFEVAAVPNGTYYFRIYAVGPGDLSLPSPPSSVTITAGAAAPGPPLALSTTAGPNSVTSNWVAPTLGAAATIYEVHVGSGFGMNDVASATTGTPTHTASSLAAGSYWVRTRAASGGLVGPWSSSVQIPVAPTPCTGPPGTPILLPVTTTPGHVAFTWIAMGQTAATFDAQISFGAGLPPAGTLSTTGAGTSLVWNQASGNFAARLVANNPCGSSARSNEVGFSIQ